MSPGPHEPLHLNLFTQLELEAFFFAVQVFVFIFSPLDRGRAAAHAPAAPNLEAANSC